ncbi:MAG: glucose 1-dehydrogenase [Henriciella sp.]|nr:glucose 1-dehydrogenase [Henriciella sp.]
MQGRLTGKVALVTGAGRGIGESIATELAAAGALVIATDIDQDAAQTTADAIIDRGGEACARRLDVTEERAWQREREVLSADYGRLDVLVNNAAIELFGPSQEIELEDWKKTQAVNVEGVFLGTKTLLPLLKRTGDVADVGTSSIVNISSVVGLIGRADQLAYMTSKGAVRLMSKGLAIEYASKKYNIRVNSVHPGGIETPMLNNVLQYRVDEGVVPASTLKEAQDLMAAHHPIGRLGQPQDIAMGVVYLASDEASFVTGTELVIDGGWTAH